jgi:hypothetical protein
MPSSVEWQRSAALSRLMGQFAGMAKSREFADYRQRVKGSIDRHYRAGLLAGTDGRGRPFAPLRSPRKGPYAGATGAPLTPHGKSSRFYANYQSRWDQVGGVWQFRGYLVEGGGIRGAIGRSLRRVGRRIRGRRGATPFLRIAQYHITGAGRNPTRNPGGVRPAAWAEIRTITRDFFDQLARPLSR